LVVLTSWAVMSSRQMFAACQVLYTPSTVCLRWTQVKKACICPTLITERALIFLNTNLVKECRLGSMGRHSNDLYVLTCWYYIWRFLFSTVSMLMFREVSNTLTFSCGYVIPILYQCVSLPIAEYYDIAGNLLEMGCPFVKSQKSSSCMQVTNCSSTKVVDAYCFKNCT